jgi:hypothetical protein
LRGGKIGIDQVASAFVTSYEAQALSKRLRCLDSQCTC